MLSFRVFFWIGGSHHELGDAFVEKTYDGMTLLLTMHVSGAQRVVYEVLQYLRYARLELQAAERGRGSFFGCFGDGIGLLETMGGEAGGASFGSCLRLE